MGLEILSASLPWLLTAKNAGCQEFKAPFLRVPEWFKCQSRLANMSESEVKNQLTAVHI